MYLNKSELDAAGNTSSEQVKRMKSVVDRQCGFSLLF